MRLKAKEKSDVRLPALLEKPGVRIEDISHPRISHIPIFVIDIDPIRQKQILLHPSFRLASSTSDIDSAAIKASLYLKRRSVPAKSGVGLLS